MRPAPPPEDEERRLAALQATGLLDSPPEPAFDEITRLASLICGTPISLISLVDRERQWFKSRVGLDASETPRDLAFCAHAILGPEILVVEDAARDDRFSDNPLVQRDPKIRFYAGAPLVTAEQLRLGTLCVIDQEPRRLTRDQTEALAMLSRQVSAQIELTRMIRLLGDANQSLLVLQRQRDEFVATLTHDLKNSLGVVGGYAALLADESLEGESRDFLDKIRSATEKALGLSRQFLEHGRRAVRSFTVALHVASLDETVGRTVARYAADPRGRGVRVEWCPGLVGIDVHHDPELVDRAVANFLTNAMNYAPPASVVRVATERLDERTCRVRVDDDGPGVAEEQRPGLFRLYGLRDPERTDSTGLGLYIVKTIAEAHGGRAEAEFPATGGSSFRLSLPIAGPSVS